MFGFTKLSLTKSRKIALSVVGLVATGGMIAIATQARAQFRTAQAAPAAAPAVVDPFAAPNQIGIPAAPPAPTRPTRRTRRIPIDPVPMPGDFRTPLPDLPKPPDIRNVPGTAPTPISGISGKVMFTPICSVTAPSASCRVRPYVGALKITSVARDRILRLATDPDGFFQVRLMPGMYVVEPDAPNFPIGTTQTITVINNVIRQMEFNFQGSAPSTGATLPPIPGQEPPAETGVIRR